MARRSVKAVLTSWRWKAPSSPATTMRLLAESARKSSSALATSAMSLAAPGGRSMPPRLKPMSTPPWKRRTLPSRKKTKMSSSTARPCASPRRRGLGRGAGAQGEELSLLVQDEEAAPDAASALPGEVDGLLGRRAGVGLAVAVDDGGLPGGGAGEGGGAGAPWGGRGGGRGGGGGGGGGGRPWGGGGGGGRGRRGGSFWGPPPVFWAPPPPLLDA